MTEKNVYIAEKKISYLNDESSDVRTLDLYRGKIDRGPDGTIWDEEEEGHPQFEAEPFDSINVWDDETNTRLHEDDIREIVLTIF